MPLGLLIFFFSSSLFGNIQEEVVKDAENMRSQQQHIHQYSCTLDECFYLYTKEEQVMSLLSSLSPSVLYKDITLLWVYRIVIVRA